MSKLINLRKLSTKLSSYLTYCNLVDPLEIITHTAISRAAIITGEKKGNEWGQTSPFIEFGPWTNAEQTIAQANIIVRFEIELFQLENHYKIPPTCSLKPL